jgi:hypothetical protein
VRKRIIRRLTPTVERFFDLFERVDREKLINLSSLVNVMARQNKERFLFKRSYDGHLERMDSLSLDYEFAITLFWAVGKYLSVQVKFTETHQFFVMAEMDKKAQKVLWTLDLSALKD